MKLCILALCMLCTPIVGVLEVAKGYLGIPYAAGTLDRGGEERLVINEDSMDCTTFVELSVARWLATQDNSPGFGQQVLKMRYRGGTVDGYLSRLHYFTDWVAENTHRHIWYELAPYGDTHLWHTDTLALSFMSSHPQSYPYLRTNAWAVDSMRSIESHYAHYVVHYIGKEHLRLPPGSLPIQDGDILALVTTIDGLDVTHLGFAVWQGDTLYLMHASMRHGRVIIDEQPLYKYLQERSSCPGVRVVRLKTPLP